MCGVWRFLRVRSRARAHIYWRLRTRQVCEMVRCTHTIIKCLIRYLQCARVCCTRQKCWLLVKFIKHNQNYYVKLDVSTSIRGLHQKKLVLSSFGSWREPCHQLVSSDGDRQRARAFYQMDQRGHTHPKGTTTGHEPWWGQLPTEPRIRPLSWHGVFPLCQEPEELSTSFF